MFQRLKTIEEGKIYNFFLQGGQILMNCKIIENDIDLKLITIEHLDNEISLNYNSIKDFNIY